MDLRSDERQRIVDVLLDHLEPVIGSHALLSATWRQHSNDVGRIELADGRVLMVKVGRFEWAEERFRAERRAAIWLAREGIVAPRHLPAPERIDGRPVLCYWRIEMPTLATVWPTRDPQGRKDALRGWGGLLRRVHAVPVDACGPLGQDGASDSRIADYLAGDLTERLRPAVAGDWPEALRALDAAVEALPDLGARTAGAPPVLLHGDPHAGNVMCRPVDEGVDGDGGAAVRCEGLIDLETAAGGPPELDLAHALVLHGPLFAQQLPDGWFDEMRRGYGLALDPFALRWFAVYHLLNLGFFSALVGDHEHAAAVAEAVAERAHGLGQEA